MNLCIAAILTAEALAEIGELLRHAQFEDGAATAGWSAQRVKKNLQLSSSNEAYREISRRVVSAIAAHEIVQAAALPRALRPPIVNRYEVGMCYGRHVDDALMGTPPMRTDLAFTLFLTAPSDYDGGELVLEDAEGEHEYKLDAGSMVLYPATTLHRVATVTGGTRTAVVGWMQSLCSDPRIREALFDLYRVRRTVFEKQGPCDEVDLLSKTYSNLLRMFAT